jgi:hypothetical protein
MFNHSKTNCQLVTPYQFYYAFPFQKGLAVVKINDRDHLIDKIGKIVY